MTDFRRDTLGSALDLGTDVLKALGYRAHRAHRATQVFRCYEEESVYELAKHFTNYEDASYISAARQHLKNFEALLREDMKRQHLGREDAWDSAGPPKEG